MDGLFSGCKCSVQTLQTLKVPGVFVVRNISTDLTLAGAHRMHVCSTDAAHLQHVSCENRLCAALVLWHIWNVTRLLRYIFKRTWHQLSLSEKSFTHLVTPWGEVQWNWWRDLTSIQVQLHRVWTWDWAGARRGVGIQRTARRAVLSWINGSVEPAAISVHYRPHPAQHYQSNSLGYTQERHTAITFVWGPKNSLILVLEKQTYILETLWSRTGNMLSKRLSTFPKGFKEC